MKFLLNIFEKKIKPNFEEGGKLKVLKPLYEAIENFAFSPAARTIQAPHGRDALDVKRYMTMVIIGLLPCTIAAFYFYGLRLLPMIIVSYAAGGAVEVLFACIRKEEIQEGFLVTGLIFPLVLPPTLPLWMVAVGVMFGVFVGKELFGGTGRNVFNPAIVGRVFLALAYPTAMTTWVATGKGLFGNMFKYVNAPPAAQAVEAAKKLGEVATETANASQAWYSDIIVDGVTSATPLGGADVSAVDMFFGNVSGSLGESSALMIIAGGVFLLMTRVSNWRTVVSILGSAAVMSFALNKSNPDEYMPALNSLLAGGLLFGAFFMATDPVSGPITNAGKYGYGILIGSLAILIRNFSAFPEGVMFAILLGNIVAPILDEIVFSIRFRRLRNEG
ncbi:MAG: RnfABCDGE type electron transport complex subunit D [Planctomycetes bacterium]|nr:RnfABCDGE type electron transport complex subunit D [Planctomycetota bacterium]